MTRILPQKTLRVHKSSVKSSVIEKHSDAHSLDEESAPRVHVNAGFAVRWCAKDGPGPMAAIQD
jgi:hypothetical protein